MEKICFVTPQFKTGGGNRVFIELANNLVELGYEVEIIFPNNSLEKNSFFKNKKVVTICIGKYSENKIKKIQNIFKCLFWIKKNRSQEKIIISDPIMSIFGWIISSTSKKIYRFIQADDYHMFDDKMIIKNNFILKFYKILTFLSFKDKKMNFIFNSRYSYDRFIEKSGRKNIECKIVHPAINHSIFYNRNYNKKGMVISIIARKHPIKGFKIFLDAIKGLEKKGIVDEINVITHDNLNGFDLNIKNLKIINPNDDTEIAKKLNETQIFISSSLSEGFGLPSLEAMACGCAVITSNNGGSLEYAINNYNSIIYEPNNSELLKEKIEFLIFNKDKIKVLANNSEEIIKRFSWKKSATDFIEILN